MKSLKYLILLAPIFLFNCQSPNEKTEFVEVSDVSATGGKEFYELKMYSFANEDQVAVTDNFLEKALIPALNKQGISPIGVFKNRLSEEDTIAKTYVLIPFKTIDQFLSYEDKLIADQKFLNDGTTYIDAPHDQPPYARISSTLIEAFDLAPKMNTPDLTGPKSERVYELRSYLGPTEKLHLNKVDMFNTGGEIDIFNRLGFNAVFYGRAIIGNEQPNLVYMTTFSDMDSRNEHWDAFRTDQQWLDLKEVEKYKNNMLQAKVFLLYPAEYSQY
ncbi:MAG: NIPSNAP family protein [Bacteroidota bacterium]